MLATNDLIGIPWVEGGRDLKGMDCYGLCIEVWRRVGKFLPEYRYDKIDPEQIHKDFFAYGFKELDHPQPLCLVTFIDIPPYSSHLGIVLENCTSFIHTTRSKPGRVRIELLESLLWKHKRSGFWELS